jgi:exodeoxyribonuclease VII small subunit
MTRDDRDAHDGARPFEQILEELERVVRDLEGDDLPLEKALARFEDGVSLAREGSSRLASAERRIEEILADGKIVPLDADER